jgi:hypothetical protein
VLLKIRLRGNTGAGIGVSRNGIDIFGPVRQFPFAPLMKTKGRVFGLVQLASTFFASVLLTVSASAQTIYSLNAVAYTDLNLQAGSNFIANPFLYADNRVSALFRSLPDGSYIQISERTNPGFNATNRFNSTTGWEDPAAELLQPKGALLWLPSPRQISFAGEVFQGQLTNQLYPAGFYGLSVIPGQGFFYCASLTSPCPHSQPPPDTQFLKWNRTVHDFDVYYYFFPSADYPTGWIDSWGNPADPRLEPGESGLFYVPNSFGVPAMIRTTVPGASGAQLREARRTGAEVTFRFNSSSNTSFALLRSTNLLDEIWETIQEGNTGADGAATVTVSNATSGVAFYRTWGTGSLSPYLFNATRYPGKFSFQFYAASNGTYFVERSLSAGYPMSWQAVKTLSLSGKALVKVADTNAAAASSTYRVRVVY